MSSYKIWKGRKQSKFPKELAYKPEQGSGHNQGILVLINVVSFA